MSTPSSAGSLDESKGYVELIEGRLVPGGGRSPDHGYAHATVVGRLSPFFRRDPVSGRPASWRILSGREVTYDEGNVFRHDVVGFRRHDDGTTHERADWVCEIVSADTARHDTVSKQRTLHRHGVPHYWRVDVENEILTVLRYDPAGYVSVVLAEPGDVVRAEPFDAIEIDVGELFGHDG